MKSSSVLNRVQVGRRPEEQFAALRRPCCVPQQSEYRSYSRGTWGRPSRKSFS